jgi:hypothetical protein
MKKISIPKSNYKLPDNTPKTPPPKPRRKSSPCITRKATPEELEKARITPQEQDWIAQGGKSFVFTTPEQEYQHQLKHEHKWEGDGSND